MDTFFAELKRRNIYRVGAAYAVVAWILLQLAASVAPILDLPPWVARTVLLLLVVGFPVALVLAWTRDFAPGDPPGRTTTGKLDWALLGALVVMIALVSYEQLAPSQTTRKAQQQAGVEAQRVAAAAPAGISIAVLPFTNLSSDAEQEFFSDGMTEEITAALAKIPDLRVVARTSAFQFKGQNKDMQAIGQALRATHLIEGSVRKAGTRVRITAQLIEAGKGTHLWSENYDRELTDVFAIQEDIATAIAGALRVPLGLQQGDTLVRNRTRDLESYDEYLRAKALYRGRDLPDALKLLEPVVARDPGFAPAWALLAQINVVARNFSLAARSGSPEEARRVVQSTQEKAETAAREAVRLDSRNAVSYGVQARVGALYRRNWAASDDLYRQALELDPNEPDVLLNYGVTLQAEGRLKDSSKTMERLRTLEPFVPIFNIVGARNLQLNGQRQAAIAIFEATPSVVGGGYFRNLWLAQAYAAAGQYAEGADTLLLMSSSQVNRQSVEAAARLLRNAAEKVTSSQALPALDRELGFVYAYVGAPDRAMENFELQLKTGAGNDETIWLPEFALLRKTQRFKALMRQFGLVDYWRERGWPDLCRPTTSDDFECD